VPAAICALNAATTSGRIELWAPARWMAVAMKFPRFDRLVESLDCGEEAGSLALCDVPWTPCFDAREVSTMSTCWLAEEPPIPGIEFAIERYPSDGGGSKTGAVTDGLGGNKTGPCASTGIVTAV